MLFWMVIVAISLIGAHEYLRMAVPLETSDTDKILLAASLSLPVVLTAIWWEDGLNGGLFLSFFLSFCYILFYYSRLTDTFSVLSRLLFGAFYVGFLCGHLVLLRLLPEGNLWLIILTAITAGSDTGAYFIGKKWGRRKLCRNVSPNKTIEGALGGVGTGVGAAVVFSLILLDDANWIILVPMAVLLTGIGILGDLCESIIKRGTNAKDSGRILLGHGGILDRMDSLFLAAPLLYYLLIFTV
jgi:phosphatidate cytidylyltransferase